MATYTITYTIKTLGDPDASRILEAAEETSDELLRSLDAYDIRAHMVSDGTSPSVTEVTR